MPATTRSSRSQGAPKPDFEGETKSSRDNGSTVDIKPEPEHDIKPSLNNGSTVKIKAEHNDDTTLKPTQTPTSTKKPPKSTLISPPPTPLPTPSLTSPTINYTYAILRGEQLVLTFEPYKSLILPFWAFRTVPIAQSSSSALLNIFNSYVSRNDFVGADMTRKFIQMGMTRAKRYANHKGGRKYKKGTREVLEKWTGEGEDGEEGRKRREKEEASEVFKKVWRGCLEDEAYRALRERWGAEKKSWEREGGGLKWKLKGEEWVRVKEGEAEMVMKEEQEDE